MVLWDWVRAGALWLAVGASLGWYYTFTYFGARGWPLPTPEALGGCLMYYFSVLNVRTEVQAMHWMAVFPAAGLLWSSLLARSAPLFGGQIKDVSRFHLRMALAALPLAAPLPFLTWYAGGVGGRFVPSRMLAVALRRGWRMPPGWLSPLFLVLALTALAMQWRVYRYTVRMSRFRAALHYGAAVSAYVAVVAATASLCAVPLRRWLE